MPQTENRKQGSHMSEEGGTSSSGCLPRTALRLEPCNPQQPHWHNFYISSSSETFDYVGVFYQVLNCQAKRYSSSDISLYTGVYKYTYFNSLTAVVGLLYPCIDSHLGEPHKFKREWASVMRCIAVFVGINHASAKLDFANNVQLSLTLAALSLGLWWTFDRSRSGLGLGITIAFVATLITQFLVYNGVYQYTSPDFLYIRSWLPCIFFSGGVTVGNIGRQLAMGIPEKPHND
ncbi:insulin-induced gene 1 protein [Alligator sinensis]|uniref:Insulin-induced gene protein n=2 Tax=Archosauria TaxID=8492 RepID=A0A3Q0G623_ALLSI|nr:insulin-induced gene 1 protein [Alligator sinensis]